MQGGSKYNTKKAGQMRVQSRHESLKTAFTGRASTNSPSLSLGQALGIPVPLSLRADEVIE